MLSLRPYQSECIDAVTEAIVSDGIKRPAVVLPTGSGKTVIFAHMISDWLSINPGQKVCVLVHRDELAQQAMKRIQDVARHLLQFVEEKDAVMCQAYLARTWPASAADECRRRQRKVRSAERSTT